MGFALEKEHLILDVEPMLACTHLCCTSALHNGAMSIGTRAALAEHRTIILLHWGEQCRTNLQKWC
jgi:hypothetical protein